MIEPNTDVLTLIFVVLIMVLPMTLHALFGEARDEGIEIDTETDQ